MHARAPFTELNSNIPASFPLPIPLLKYKDHDPQPNEISPQQIISNIMSPISTDLRSSLKDSARPSRRDMRRNLREAMEGQGLPSLDAPGMGISARAESEIDTLARDSEFQGEIVFPGGRIEVVPVAREPTNTVVEGVRNPKAIKDVRSGETTMVNTVVEVAKETTMRLVKPAE